MSEPGEARRPARGGARSATWRPRFAVAAPLALLAAGAALAGLIAVMTDPGPEQRAPDTPAPGPAAPAARAAATGPGPSGTASLSERGAASIPVSSGSAEEHLALARRLLAANRADVPGAAHQGLLQAEAEVQAALGLGGVDAAAARRLLADVNGALASDWAVTPQDQRAFQQREREALRALLEVAPADGEARYRYAMLLDDRGWRIEELTRAVRDAPRDLRPRRALGEDLLEVGRADEGARMLLDAAELCSREELGVHGPDLVHLLRHHGREEEEARLREKMERAGY